jgi:hypothetical protein
MNPPNRWVANPTFSIRAIHKLHEYHEAPQSIEQV